MISPSVRVVLPPDVKAAAERAAAACVPPVSLSRWIRWATEEALRRLDDKR